MEQGRGLEYYAWESASRLECEGLLSKHGIVHTGEFNYTLTSPPHLLSFYRTTCGNGWKRMLPASLPCHHVEVGSLFKLIMLWDWDGEQQVKTHGAREVKSITSKLYVVSLHCETLPFPANSTSKVYPIFAQF